MVSKKNDDKMFEKFCHQHPNTFQKAKTSSLPNEPMAPGAIADRPGGSLRQICTEAPCQEEGHGRRGTLTWFERMAGKQNLRFINPNC